MEYVHFRYKSVFDECFWYHTFLGESKADSYRRFKRSLWVDVRGKKSHEWSTMRGRYCPTRSSGPICSAPPVSLHPRHLNRQDILQTHAGLACCHFWPVLCAHFRTIFRLAILQADICHFLARCCCHSFLVVKDFSELHCWAACAYFSWLKGNGKWHEVYNNTFDKSAIEHCETVLPSIQQTKVPQG